MTTFFKATQTATRALYGDFTFKAYYNFGFHLDALTSFICHISRALYNLSCLALRALITPLCILNPLAWLSLPDHFMNLADDALALSVSLVTVAVTPFVFLMRTLTSLFRGYEEGSEYDWGIEDEEEKLALAMTVFS